MTVAVYFDLDGTLIRFEREFEAILTTTIEEAVGRVEPAWVDAVGEYFWGYFRAFDGEPYRRAFADLFESEGLGADPDAVARDLIGNELAATTVDPAVRGTVERLAGADGPRIGVLTNGVGAVQREKLRRHDLAEQFDEVLVSYEVGAHKPDDGAFEAARRRIDAERYVMVGDDLEADVVPAQRCGFEGIHVDEGLDPSARVRSVGTLGAVGRLFSD